MLTVKTALSGLDDTHEDPQLERGKVLKKTLQTLDIVQTIGDGGGLSKQCIIRHALPAVV